MKIIPEDKIIQTTMKELKEALIDLNNKRERQAYNRIKHAIYLLDEAA